MAKATHDPAFTGSNITLSNGNRTVAYNASNFLGHSSFANSRGMSSGKYYWEWVIDEHVSTSTAYVAVGIGEGLNKHLDLSATGEAARTFSAKGTKHYIGSAGSAYGNTWINTDVIGIAVDFTNDAIWFAINGVWQNSATLTEVQNGTTTNAAWTGVLADRTWYPVVSVGDDTVNSGQVTARYDPIDFTNTVPSGFTAGPPDAWAETYDELDGRTRHPDVEEVRLSGPNRIDTIGETTADGGYLISHIGKGSGKYYFEAELHDIAFGRIGIVEGPSADNDTSASIFADANHYVFIENGDKGNAGSSPTYGATWADGNRIGCAVSFDTGAIWFSIDGTWQAGATLTEVQDETTTNAAYTFTVDRDWHIGIELFSTNGNDTDIELITDPAGFTGTQPSGYNAWKAPVTADDGPMAGIDMTVPGTANVQPVHMDDGPMASIEMGVSGASNVQPVHADTPGLGMDIILGVSGNAAVPISITDGPVGSMDMTVSAASNVQPLHMDDGPMASIVMDVSGQARLVQRLTDNMPGMIMSVSGSADIRPIRMAGGTTLVLGASGAASVIPKGNTSEYFTVAMEVSGSGNVQPIHCT
jgi:hypothetical protein